MYQPATIETKWQTFWEEHHLFKTPDYPTGPKYYILDMWPYPSSDGLHVGHPEGYTATDILARYKRACGFSVLHPMGWDAFGLPAEQFAIKTGIQPQITTQKSIERFRKQLKALGFSYDWSREQSSADPSYYRWTQTLFLKLYEQGLVYPAYADVNWCPALKTVLANEEVVAGVSERGGHPVYRVPMKQWMLKITAYAERLLVDLDRLDWPESTKQLQRHWIGKSQGAILNFELHHPGNNKSNHKSRDKLSIFTTRPETIYGCSFLVIAPEHPLALKCTATEPLVAHYCKASSQKSELERQENQETSGVFTGIYAIHPFTKVLLPVWVSDYVLMHYGCGAIMGVPGHDDKDHQFALHAKLPILSIMDSQSDATDPILINSEMLNGLTDTVAREKILQILEQSHQGERTTFYKLRDWLFSRQRYWGEPIPLILTADGSIQPVRFDALPVTLPEIVQYEPSESGESPLAKEHEWKTTSYNGASAERVVDTMPGSAGASWYFLRFCDPHNATAAFSIEKARAWMPVDLYLGGPEHAVGHLLYARFWTKVLFDIGMSPVDEPFQKLVHQGMILGEDGEKMSKSRGNVINPDHIIEQYGADTLRLYLMFIGPLEKDKPWQTHAIEGIYRFLQRAYRLYDHIEEPHQQGTLATEDARMLHQTIRKVTHDIENLKFNTAISQMMIFVNHFTKYSRYPFEALKTFAQLLQPFAPHLAETCWERCQVTSYLSLEPWPNFIPELASTPLITIAVQINGKTRSMIEVPADAEQPLVMEKVFENPNIIKAFSAVKDKNTLKVIFVKNKIVNFVL